MKNRNSIIEIDKGLSSLHTERRQLLVKHSLLIIFNSIITLISPLYIVGGQVHTDYMQHPVYMHTSVFLTTSEIAETLCNYIQHVHVNTKLV